MDKIAYWWKRVENVNFKVTFALVISRRDYNFSNNPYYVSGDWNGEEAYFVTAYFVDTSIICNGGSRVREDH